MTGKANILGHHQTLLLDLENALSHVRISIAQEETPPDWNKYLLLARDMLKWMHESRVVDRQPCSIPPARWVECHEKGRKSVCNDASAILDETIVARFGTSLIKI